VKRRQLTEDLTVGLVGVNAVDYREGEFSFGKVFRKPFMGRILDYNKFVVVSFSSSQLWGKMVTYYGALKVHEVITNLEIYADKVNEGDIITWGIVV
jgi:hypothetical protein